MMTGGRNITKDIIIQIKVPSTPILEEVGLVSMELADNLSVKLKMLLNAMVCWS